MNKSLCKKEKAEWDGRRKKGEKIQGCLLLRRAGENRVEGVSSKVKRKKIPA